MSLVVGDVTLDSELNEVIVDIAPKKTGGVGKYTFVKLRRRLQNSIS